MRRTTIKMASSGSNLTQLFLALFLFPLVVDGTIYSEEPLDDLGLSNIIDPVVVDRGTSFPEESFDDLGLSNIIDPELFADRGLSQIIDQTGMGGPPGDDENPPPTPDIGDGFEGNAKRRVRRDDDDDDDDDKRSSRRGNRTGRGKSGKKGEKRNNKRKEKCWGRNGDICVSEDCVLTAAEMLVHMNTTIDPCDQFYQFSCENYINSAEINPPFTDTTPLIENFLQILEEVTETFQEDTLLLKGQLSEAVNKSKQFFDACVSTEDTLDPIFNVINDLGSWTLTSNDELNTWTPEWSIEEALAKSHHIKSRAIFGVGSTKATDRELVRAYIYYGSPLMRRNNYGNETYPSKRPAVNETLEVLTQTLDNSTAAQFVDQIADLDREIGELEAITTPFLETIVPMTPDEITELLGGAFDMKKYACALLGKNVDVIYVYGTEYFEQLGTILSNYDQETIQNYIVYASLMSLKNYLPPSLAAVRDTYNTALGSTYTQPDVESCGKETFFELGFVSSAIYFQDSITTEDREMLQEMAKYLKNAARNAFRWMDRQSRRKAQRKVDRMIVNIAYPEWMDDISLLDQYYAELETSASSFGNKVSYKRHDMKLMVEGVEEPVSDAWIFFRSMGPAVPNALYATTLNQVAIMGGIMQKPFYDRNYPKAWLFGTIGAVIGHEIMHGFGPNIRERNAYGLKDENDRFGDAVMEEFEERDQCLIDQYGSMTFSGFPLNGTNSIGENFADNAGLSISYSAYQTWKWYNWGQDINLPGLSLSSDQLFFLAWSQSWCGAYTNIGAMITAQFGRYPPYQMRAEVPLMNHPSFAKAYKCPRGSRMNPISKCSTV